MPTHHRSHEQCLPVVCVLCLGKSSVGLTDNHKQLISLLVYKDFYKNESFLPSGICYTCKNKLNSQGKPDEKPLPPKILYDDLVNHVKLRPRPTRATESTYQCLCEICRVSLAKTKTPGNIAKNVCKLVLNLPNFDSSWSF